MISQDPIELELEWGTPSHPLGQLLGYRIKYGIRNQTLREEIIDNTNQYTFKIKDVGMCISYRLSLITVQEVPLFSLVLVCGHLRTLLADNFHLQYL